MFSEFAKYSGISVVRNVESLVKILVTRIAEIEQTELTALFGSSEPGHFPHASTVC